MLNWSIKKLEIPLKYTWKIARGEIKKKTLFIVEVRSTDIVGLGEVSFSDRYGESADLIEKGFSLFLSGGPNKLSTLEETINFLEDLALPNSLRFAIESAFVHYLANLSEKSVHELLAVNPISSLQTSFSLPIMPPGEVNKFIKEHNLSRFSVLKVKVDGDCAFDLIREVEKNFRGNLRVDANESFRDPDAVMKFIERVGPSCPIEFLEQPLEANNHDGHLYLFQNADVDIMADESIVDGEITEYHAQRFHAVNIKLMKAGGYMRALKQMKMASEFGLKIMLGCMVETSLGISSAMNIAYGIDYIDLDGFLFLKEDPYNFLTEENGRLILSHLQ